MINLQFNNIIRKTKMELINQIINELMDYDKPLSGPLLKTKVLASRIENQELLNWVNGELNGYTSVENLPEYRKTTGSIFGNYVNGAMHYSNALIPLANMSEEEKATLSEANMFDSISSIESLANTKDIKLIVSPEAKDFIEFNIRSMGNRYFQIISLYKNISYTFFGNILSNVRSKLLEFMLQLEKQLGHETDIINLKNQNNLITQIVNTTINNNGDGNINNTGNDSSIKANVNVTKGNASTLKDSLRKHNVEESDIKDLLLFVNEEIPTQENQYSLKVSEWIKKMISKAVDGSWQVSIGAAGGIISDALATYYGWK